MDTTSIFVGNILAVASITVNDGAHLFGRAIAQAAVTLINDVVDATYVDASAADAEAAAAAEAEATDIADAVIPGGITGAAAGVFPSGAVLYKLPLSDLTLGKGLHLSSDGTASGQIQIELDGTSVLGPQTITVDGEVSSGSFDTFGNPTFSGLATVDVGNGSVPLLSVPFIVKLTSTGVDWWTLALTVAQSVLPDLPITVGSITVHPLPPQ